jgi:hypothetical protein
MWPLAGRHT